MATLPTFTPAQLVKLVFDDFDTNKDGALTQKELGVYQRSLKLGDAPFKAAFAKLDLNSDGKITKAELTSILTAADTNHDGRLTIAELKAGAELIGIGVDHFQSHHA